MAYQHKIKYRQKLKYDYMHAKIVRNMVHVNFIQNSKQKQAQ